MKGFRLALLLAPLLVSCTMAPRYTRPEALVPGSWPEADSLALSELAAVSQPSVEEFYRDPRLRSLLELTREHNLDLRLATLNAETVRAYYRIERANLLPAVSAVGAGTRHLTPADLASGGTATISEQYSVQGGISAWELDLFGRLRSLKKQALEQYLASREGERGARLAITAAVGQAWLGLAASREQLGLARSTVVSFEELYTLVENRFQAGLASRLDLLRAQTQLNAAQQAEARYRQLVAQDRNALARIVGAPIPEELLPASLDDVLAPLELEVGLSSAVLLERPDIQAAEHRLRAANAFIGAARAAFFPRISLTGLAGTASAELNGLFGPDSRTWTFSPQVTLPLFDARVFSAHSASALSRESALTQYQASIQSAFRDVSDALVTRQALCEQARTQDELARASEQSLDLARQRYDSGLDSYLSVLDAQRSWYAARESQVALHLADLASRIQLYSVLGGAGQED